MVSLVEANGEVTGAAGLFDTLSKVRSVAVVDFPGVERDRREYWDAQIGMAERVFVCVACVEESTGEVSVILVVIEVSTKAVVDTTRGEGLLGGSSLFFAGPSTGRGCGAG